MKVLLAPEEIIVKNWDYAKYNEDNDISTHSITVTNKRIILTEKSEKYADRQELLIDNVVGVTTEYAQNQVNPKRQAGIFLTVFGVLLLIAGILVADFILIYYGLIGIIPGSVMIIAGMFLLVSKKLEGKLVLVIQTNIPKDTISYGLQINSISLSEKSTTQTLRITVNVAVAEEIANEIGALVLARGAQATIEYRQH